MANTNIINAVFGSGLCAVTTSAFRANYGMVLRFSGIDLPTAFEVDFSNYDVAGRDSITAIGQNGEVQIPDDLWDSGLNIYAYVYLHPTDDSGVTVYTVTIPVLGRPNRTDETPTPHEQTVIEQAISALNDAVEQTAADVASADASATAAAQSEANASVSERSAAASASAALASQNAAESAAQSATESASGAAESAQNAANSASQAAQSATAAQESAEQAEQAVQSITDDVERAERAAATATGKATEAASSAATASTKAAQAEQSATAAAQSASSASTAAQNAAESEQLAESHATDAEQAKQDAQDAQTAAETAAESVSGLSAQIAQNTADIADLVQSKAGALIDTASGSIASFVPDATIPTVKGLTVNVEPQQDLHGYDAPWPAGGGKNLTNYSEPITSPTGTQSMIRIFSLYLEAGVTYTYSCKQSANVTTSTRNTLSVVPSGGSYMYENTSQNYNPSNSRHVLTFTPSVSGTCDFYMWMHTFSNAVVFSEWQVEKSSSFTSYAPYSNICPISGWDAVDVWNDPKYGGTIKWNQLFPLQNVSFTGTNFTITSARDGAFVVTATATATSTTASNVTAVGAGTFNAGHIYAFLGTNYGIQPDLKGFSVYADSVFKCRTPVYNNVTFVFDGLSAGTYRVYPMLFDLTEMFGETKAEEILAMGASVGAAYVKSLFPKDYYDYDTAYTETCVSAVNGDPYLNYTIQLGQTVYGCKIHATQGKMVVDRAEVDLGTLTWNASSRETTYKIFSTNGIASLIKDSANNWTIPTNFMCSQYKTVTFNEAYAGSTNGVISYAKGNHSVNLVDSNFADYSVAEVAAALSGVQLVYELATPITVSLTPLEISVLTGQNNIWADSGDVSVEYAADLKTYIDNKIAAAVAALS